MLCATIALIIVKDFLEYINVDRNNNKKLGKELLLNRRRVSLSTLVSVLMSALFTYNNLTILLEACNSIFDEIAHAILLQLIHI